MTFGKEDQDLKNTLDVARAPMPFDQVVSILQEKYQAPLDSIFQSLDVDCLSTSLGQVHFGTLKDGTKVVVKVQHPGTADSMEKELDYHQEIEHQKDENGRAHLSSSRPASSRLHLLVSHRKPSV